MLPLVDTHCHLFAGLDDGPRTMEDALAMCRISYDEGVRLICAVAHQNDRYPDVTPERIRVAAKELNDHLRTDGLALITYPAAEVMVRPELEDALKAGELVSVGDQGKYLLIEMPHGLVVEVSYLVQHLIEGGIRPILAHPERYPALLEDTKRIEHLIQLGCLMQVTAESLTNPPSWMSSRVLKDWLRRGLIHLIGSDGHSPRRRPPRMADAYEQIRYWTGDTIADRVCSTNGMMVLQGLPFNPAPPTKQRGWLQRLWS